VLDSTKIGDSVTLTANIPTAGTYDLHVTSKNYNLRGIFRVSIDGVKVGQAEDEYSAKPIYADFDLGPIAIATAGNHEINFTVTGRNPLSTDYKICLDYLEFDSR
jgi:hypothetical protein